MNKAPRVGARVRCDIETPTRGRFTGVVYAVFPEVIWDYERHQPTGVFAPQRDWFVGVKVDAIPARWPYPGVDRIAPCVADLELVDGGHDAPKAMQ